MGTAILELRKKGSVWRKKCTVLGVMRASKINTIGTELPAFVEWGGEARRERRRWFLFVPYW